MPTPSSNAPDPPSPRFHPFSSCPDPEEAQLQTATTQPASENATSPDPTSPPSWRPFAQPSGTGAHSARVDVGDTSSDSRSISMSPGPQREAGAAREVGIGRVPEDMVAETRGGPGLEEVYKPADGDEEMSPAPDESTGAGAVGGGAGFVGERTEGGRTLLGQAPGRRKSTTDHLSLGLGEIHEVDAWGSVRGRGPRWVEDSGLVGLDLEYSHKRVIPASPSVYLQPGSRFIGTQQSERQRYDVEVEIKHVDMRDSFLCGYLRIQGLTDDHPTLTTYFEGEIIGTKYGFITQHQGWGASEKIDLSHWSKFTAFRPYIKQARKGGHTLIADVDQRENIFMRWKEHFLVPDHRVRTINGASFEGFYYICFNQVRGEVSGIYFHSKSEKFQQLELKHVDNKGCFGAMEFR